MRYVVHYKNNIVDETSSLAMSPRMLLDVILSSGDKDNLLIQENPGDKASLIEKSTIQLRGRNHEEPLKTNIVGIINATELEMNPIPQSTAYLLSKEPYFMHNATALWKLEPGISYSLTKHDQGTIANFDYQEIDHNGVIDEFMPTAEGFDITVLEPCWLISTPLKKAQNVPTPGGGGVNVGTFPEVMLNTQLPLGIFKRVFVRMDNLYEVLNTEDVYV